MPSHVDVFGVLLRVYPFVSPVLRCFNCQLFRHGTNFCSNKSRCVNCGEEQAGSCNAPSKCANCGQDHKDSSKECSFFAFNCEVNKLMALESISKAHAKIIIRENYKSQVELTNNVVVDKFISTFPNPFVDKNNPLLINAESSTP